MSKNFDAIATVSINMSSPVLSDVSFDNILIVGMPPNHGGATQPPLYGEYSSLDEVLVYWTLDSIHQEVGAESVALAARVAFAQTPRPTKIYIATVTGSETITDAITRALDHDDWYICCAAAKGSEPNINGSGLYEQAASLLAGYDRLFCYTELAAIEDPYVPTVSATSEGAMYAIGVYGNADASQIEQVSNNFANIAFAVKWLSYEVGSETAAFKSVSGIQPCNITSDQMRLLDEANINYILQIGNKTLTMNGITIGGEWADVMRFKAWLQNDMQTRVVNLFVTNPKVPFTDPGIALIQNQMIASLKAGQTRGGIAPSEYDDDGNEIPGFTTSVPLAADISAADKASRNLRDCKFRARLAGAIHFVEIEGSLGYEM